MRRRIARLALQLALRAANGDLQQLWRLGYDAGHRDARRAAIRGLFPRASAEQLDRILAMKPRDS